MRPLLQPQLSISSKLIARANDSSRVVSEFVRTLKGKLDSPRRIRLDLPLPDESFMIGYLLLSEGRLVRLGLRMVAGRTLYSRQIGARLRANQGHDGMAFRQGGTGRSAVRFRPLHPKTRTFMFDLDLS